MKKIAVIVGKNFGDEGKGLATDYFSGRMPGALVIKHNGGAQAGHTVDRTDKRFVFHQLSSGSFRAAPTFLSSTFLPDLLKLEEERAAFCLLSGQSPLVYIDSQCRLVTVFDVILNSYAESQRGSARHGSCGMGINETVLRNENPEFALSLADFKALSSRQAGLFLEKIRTGYIPLRLNQMALGIKEGDLWCDLVRDGNIAFNAAEKMRSSLDGFSMVNDVKEMLCGYDRLIFEGAQGLLLDRNNAAYQPHLTPSETGSKNPFRLLEKAGISHSAKNTEVCYVTRSYVTRHGVGRLPHECDREAISIGIKDETNVFNEWQQALRFARHPAVNEFADPVAVDGKCCGDADVSLMVTHLNETNGKIATANGDVDVADYLDTPESKSVFNRLYLSFSPFATEIQSVPSRLWKE
jgi:adenylosuccinate synthase